jgi:OOP family OmpA-OmpF porin
MGKKIIGVTSKMILLSKKQILFLIIFLLTCSEILPQTNYDENYFLHQNFILSVETGASYGFTDYKSSNLEPLIRASFEYYPISIDNARLGLKIFGGGLRIGLSDSRSFLPDNDIQQSRQVPSDIYTDMIQIGGAINLGYQISENIIPYLSLGGVYIQFSPKNSDGMILTNNSLNRYDKNIFSFFVEGGIKYRLNERFSLTAGLSFYPTQSDYLDDISAGKQNDSFMAGNIGLSVALSGSPDSDNDGVPDYLDKCPDTPKGITVDKFGCPIDSDKDGVPDYLDKCPNTPLGVAVDKLGCPIDSDHDGIPDYLDKCPDTPSGVAVDEFGCPLDSDKDGVPDYLDKCPNTPQDIKVDSLGCPIDTDHDGVPDYLDKCPDTPPNTKVDSNGCPQKDQANAETFYQFNLRGDDTFETNSATLKNSAKLLLNEIAFYIQNQPNTKWRIEGHMDSEGSITFIKKLSYDRAKSVFDYLVSQGVSPDRLTIYGLGDSFPIGNNNTAEGRSTNRRIMIIRED